MSIGQQLKGKVIWGTSVWRILLETEDRKLHNDFQGTLTLYERRHEKSKHEFKSLDEFVNVLRDLWKDSLRADTVQDTRLARWIEEYFDEKNISANYYEVLDAIRGEFQEVPPLQLSQKTKLEKEDLDKIIPETEEFAASGTTYKIEGDFADNEEVNRILENFILSNKPKRHNIAKSTITYTMPDRTQRTMDQERKVKDHALRNVVTLTSGLRNDFGVPISEVVISDVIPYDYQINDIKFSGIETIQPEKKKTGEGLKFIWQIEHMQPRENIEIEYHLSKRMLRTILIRDDYDLTVLNTYNDIEQDEQGVWIESSYVFQEETPVVENVKILDLIPSEFKLLESKPEAAPPLAQIRSSRNNTEISWSYTEVPSNTQFSVTYELSASSKILRDKMVLIDDNDIILANVVRVLKPKADGSGFGAIMAIMAYKNLNNDIIIREKIPLNYWIELKGEIPGDIVEEEENDKRVIKWKINNLKKDKLYQVFINYNGEEIFNFDNLSIVFDNQEKEITHSSDAVFKDEIISFPENYYNLIEK